MIQAEERLLRHGGFGALGDGEIGIGEIEGAHDHRHVFAVHERVERAAGVAAGKQSFGATAHAQIKAACGGEPRIACFLEAEAMRVHAGEQAVVGIMRGSNAVRLGCSADRSPTA